MLTDLEWFMAHGHESALRDGVYRVRVWPWGAKRPSADGKGTTFAQAVAAARDEAHRLAPAVLINWQGARAASPSSADAGRSQIETQEGR